MNKKIKQIPKFKNSGEEQSFFHKSSSLDYFDTSKEIKLNLNNLKPSTSVMTIRSFAM